MKISMDRQRTGQALRRAALVAAVLMLALFTWLPTLIGSDESSGDRLYYKIAQQIVCGKGPSTGWPINDGSLSATLGSFSPTLPSYLSTKAACSLGGLLHISEKQSYLVIGITLTVLITYWASIAAGIGLRPSLLISYGLATAPCSFSRVGHLPLSQLWAVMPCISVCSFLLTRAHYPRQHRKTSSATSIFGLAMGFLSFTGQEYYAVFSTLCIFTCYTIGIIRETREFNQTISGTSHQQVDRNPRGETRFLYIKMAAGYSAAMAIYVLSKQLLWRIPEWAHEATYRAAAEQFIYGFWPSNIVTSPLFNSKLIELFTTKHHLPVTETPFMSSSGILVITGLAVSLACWMNARKTSGGEFKKEDSMILAFGGVLIATISIACVVATAGGLGTLFAVLISPQLRALNRITPYFYCAALVICSIKFDQIISAIPGSRKAGADS